MTGRYDHAAMAKRAKLFAEWRERALCNGRAGLFGTPPGHGRKTPAEQAAIALCRDCPVLGDCYADGVHAYCLDCRRGYDAARRTRVARGELQEARSG